MRCRRAPVAIHLLLILCVALTGIGLGAARGTVAIDGHAVLCSGEAIVIHRAADGAPSGRVHLCPDMALALLAAVAPPALPDAPRRAARPAKASETGRRAASGLPPRATARAPPVFQDVLSRTIS